jgi:hypothetical protein
MVGVKVRSRMDSRKVVRAGRRGSIKSLGQAGAYLRGIAKRSIKVSKDPAPAGHQPHSRKGRLKGAILFGVEKEQQRVVIGPTVTAVGRIGRTHEFGGTEPPKRRKGRKATWKLEVGGHGPISVDGGKAVVVKLKTQKQVARAKEEAAKLPPAKRPVQSNKPRRYPRRPFMGPALVIGRPQLPRLWANSVRN